MLYWICAILIIIKLYKSVANAPYQYWLVLKNTLAALTTASLLSTFARKKDIAETKSEA